MKIENPPFINESMAIEEAQSQIKAIAKTAVLKNWNKDDYLNTVNKTVKELLLKIRNIALRETCYKALMRFALLQYNNQVELMRIYAEWFAFALIRYRRDRKISDLPTKTEIPKEITNSNVFREYTELYSAKISDIADSAYNRAVPMETVSKKYAELVNEKIIEIAVSEAKEDYTSNVNLRNIAEMTLRYEYNLNMIDDMRESGVDLVYIIPHANCSKRCEKYQVGGYKNPSGLYSLSQREGVQDGIKFKPLSFATNNPDDVYITKAGKRYQNGCLTGFNCRHKIMPYKKGAQPKPIPARVINRQRELEATQREYERSIRRYKDYAVQYKGINPDKYRKYRQLAIQTNKEYVSFSRKNNIPFVRERTRILSNFTEYTIPDRGMI